jgi:hypothetical protein
MAAHTVVGPTNLKPAAFSSFESCFDSGVCASQSAVLCGTP